MQEFMSFIQRELQGLYPESEIKSFAMLVLTHVTGKSKAQLLADKNTTFYADQRHLARAFVEQLKAYVPIQHLIGETEFYGLMFAVNGDVLIPRPETEELVDLILRENKARHALNILDIGTGSGCIAISLKTNLPLAQVTAMDISDAALLTAAQNALRNNAEIIFQKLDIRTWTNQNQKWNIIVSNPPYIPQSEDAEIQPNVLLHEPHTALFVPDNDPLLYYRTIAQFAVWHLHPKGKLYFEVHRNFGNATVELLQSFGYREVKLLKDISANDRMVSAMWSGAK
jgi:release factor glutamine methyltransferase